MICSECKTKEASFHFRGLINGANVNLELCESCAKKKGLNLDILNSTADEIFTAPFSFPTQVAPAFNELFDVLTNWHSKLGSAPVNKSACPACHWTLAQFKKSGRMGCSECYLHFHDETENFLVKIHGSTSHKGKKAPAEVAKMKIKDREKMIASLRLELQQAISKEQYELAAKLRDKIVEFEKKYEQK